MPGGESRCTSGHAKVHGIGQEIEGAVQNGRQKTRIEEAGNLILPRSKCSSLALRHGKRIAKCDGCGAGDLVGLRLQGGAGTEYSVSLRMFEV